jgi:hypothetical protein
LNTLSMPVFNGDGISVINNCDSLLAFSLPAFVGSVNAWLTISDCLALASVSLPVLANIQYLQVNDNPAVPSLNIASLQSGSLAIYNNIALASIDISSWVGDTIYMNSSIQSCPLLTSITATNFNTSFNSLFFNDNGLSSASISQMLVDFDTNGATDCTLNLTGGTNAGFAALSPAGAAAHASLVGKFWNITMNP